MPDLTAPNYSTASPASREDVIALADAVRLLYPGAIVKAMDDDSPAWIYQIILPTSETRGVSIGIECNTWSAHEYWHPNGRVYIGHNDPLDLIAVIRDAITHIGCRSRALGV